VHSFLVSASSIAPPHLVTLGCVLLVVWVLMRWGDLILLGYGFWYFCKHQWDVATFCLIAALFVGLLKGAWMGGARIAGYRGPWV
jgi:hypothetical protein